MVAKALGSGVVGSWDKLHQGDCLGAPFAAGRQNGSRAGVQHGVGAIPSQGIG